jgi:hypothetical protein
MTISSMAKNPDWRKKPYIAFQRMKNMMMKADVMGLSSEMKENICFEIFKEMVDEFHKEQRGKK